MESFSISLKRYQEEGGLENEPALQNILVSAYIEENAPLNLQEIQTMNPIPEDELLKKTNSLKENLEIASDQNNLVVQVLNELQTILKDKSWLSLVLAYPIIFKNELPEEQKEQNMDNLLRISGLITNAEDFEGLEKSKQAIVHYFQNANTFVMAAMQHKLKNQKECTALLSKMVEDFTNFRINVYELELFFLSAKFKDKFGRADHFNDFCKMTQGLVNNLKNGAASSCRLLDNNLCYYDYLQKEGFYEVVVKRLIKKINQTLAEIKQKGELSYELLEVIAEWEELTLQQEDVLLVKINDAKETEKKHYLEKMRNVLNDVLIYSSCLKTIWNFKQTKVKQKIFLIKPRLVAEIIKVFSDIAEKSQEFLSTIEHLKTLDFKQKQKIIEDINESNTLISDADNQKTKKMKSKSFKKITMNIPIFSEEDIQNLDTVFFRLIYNNIADVFHNIKGCKYLSPQVEAEIAMIIDSFEGQQEHC